MIIKKNDGLHTRHYSMSLQYVLTLCPYSMSVQYVLTLCSYNMSVHYVLQYVLHSMCTYRRSWLLRTKRPHRVPPIRTRTRTEVPCHFRALSTVTPHRLPPICRRSCPDRGTGLAEGEGLWAWLSVYTRPL